MDKLLREGYIFNFTMHSQTMTKTFNIILLLVLMVTLPLRGFATVTATAGSEHQHHGMMAVHAMAAETPAAALDAPANPHPQKNAYKCTLCSACCSGSMPSPFFSDYYFAVQNSNALIVFADQTYSGFIPDGPDRPPRTSLH